MFQYGVNLDIRALVLVARNVTRATIKVMSEILHAPSVQEARQLSLQVQQGQLIVVRLFNATYPFVFKKTSKYEFPK